MPFMPTNNPTFVRQPNRQGCQLTTTAGGIVYTAGPNGSKITALLANNSDTAYQALNVNIVDANKVVYTLLKTTLPFQISPPIDLMRLFRGLPVDRYGNHYLTLAIGDTLAAEAPNLTDGAAINLFAIGGDY